VRIISGKYRSRRIDPGKLFKHRPTTDRAKEGLFNILNNEFEFEDSVVADLFAGTGNISFEFLSRGVEKVVAVESNVRYCNFMRKTARELNENALFLEPLDVFRFISKKKGKYDLIFADPPYELKEIKRLPILIKESQILAEGGVFILEHGAETNFIENEYLDKTRKYGHVNFSFFFFD